MAIRGVRGANSIPENTPEGIYVATQDLLKGMIAANQGLAPEDVASIIFTTTPQIDAAFPAKAARTMTGWEHVPLLCSQEITVPGSLKNVVRILLHWNTELPQKEMRHIYLGEAAHLRPDLTMQSGSRTLQADL